MSVPGILFPIPRLGITPASSMKAFFYAPGGTTKQNTYTDSTLATPNSNPMTASGAGLFDPIYLDPALGYKVVLCPSTEVNDPPTGTPILTQDNLYLPSMDLPNVISKNFASSPYTVVSGDGFNVLILVDTSGGNVTIAPYTAVGNAGKRITVIKTTSDANTVTIDPNGAQTWGGAANLVISAQYSASTGESDNANWQVVGSVSAAVLNGMLNEGRLTLTTGVPVTTADVSAATSAYFTPYVGNRIALYDGTNWNVRTFSEIAISLVGLTASKPYDIFAYDNAGVVTIETLVWTNTTTRATALVQQNGVYVKTGALTRRYLGTIYINSSGGQSDDTLVKRYVWNMNNRVLRALRRLETTASWTYNSATVRQANGSTSNQVEVMVGLAEDAVMLQLIATATGTAADYPNVAIGLDSTTVVATGCVYTAPRLNNSSYEHSPAAALTTYPGVGYHFLAWLEWRGGAATMTFEGSNPPQAGLSGVWRA